jgi:hypothetical protein
MIRKKLITFLAVTTMVGMIQTAQASFTDTLADLANSGGSLTIGDKTFSGFGYVASGADASELNTDAAGLNVTASIVNGMYYLDFAGAIAVNNLRGASELAGDLELIYTVTANAGSIVMIDQNYTPNALSVAGNQIIIGETVKNNAGTIVGNSSLTLNPQDFSDPPPESGDNLDINPSAQELSVVKDILIYAAPGQVVGLSDVEQSYHQVPEPTTIIAGALLLLPFGASALRILRRNRMS